MAPTRWRLSITRTLTQHFSSPFSVLLLLWRKTEKSPLHKGPLIPAVLNDLICSSYHAWSLWCSRSSWHREAECGVDVSRPLLCCLLEDSTDNQLASPDITYSYTCWFRWEWNSWLSLVTVRFIWSKFQDGVDGITKRVSMFISLLLLVLLLQATTLFLLFCWWCY